MNVIADPKPLTADTGYPDPHTHIAVFLSLSTAVRAVLLSRQPFTAVSLHSYRSTPHPYTTH